MIVWLNNYKWRCRFKSWLGRAVEVPKLSRGYLTGSVARPHLPHAIAVRLHVHYVRRAQLLFELPCPHHDPLTGNKEESKERMVLWERPTTNFLWCTAYPYNFKLLLCYPCLACEGLPLGEDTSKQHDFPKPPSYHKCILSVSINQNARFIDYNVQKRFFLYL